MLWSLWGMWHGIQCRSSHLKTGLHQLISQNSVHQIWAKLAKKSQDWSKWIVYLAWEYISFTSLDIGSSSLVYRIALSFLIAGIICRAWIGISKCLLYLTLNQSPQERALFIFLQLTYALSEPNLDYGCFEQIITELLGTLHETMYPVTWSRARQRPEWPDLPGTRISSRQFRS